MLFRGYPITHFFWVIGSLYLIFFVMRTTTNYAAALAFAIPIGVALPVWDRSLPSQVQVEGTLWPILIIAVGAGVTVGTEALYRIFDRSDPLIAFVDDLLLAVQQVAESIAAHHAPPKSVLDRVLQYRYDRHWPAQNDVAAPGSGPDPAGAAQRPDFAGGPAHWSCRRSRAHSPPARRRRRDPPARTFCEARSNPNGATRVRGHFRISSLCSRGSRLPASPCFKRWNEPSHSSPKSFNAMRSSMVPRTRQGGTGGALCFCLMHSRTRNIYASPLPDAWLPAFVTYSTTRSTGPASSRPSLLASLLR